MWWPISEKQISSHCSWWTICNWKKSSCWESPPTSFEKQVRELPKGWCSALGTVLILACLQTLISAGPGLSADLSSSATLSPVPTIHLASTSTPTTRSDYQEAAPDKKFQRLIASWQLYGLGLLPVSLDGGCILSQYLDSWVLDEEEGLASFVKCPWFQDINVKPHFLVCPYPLVSWASQVSTPAYCRCVLTGREQEKGSLHIHCPGPSTIPESIRLQEEFRLAYPDDVCLVGIPTLAMPIEDKDAVLHVWPHMYMQSCDLATSGSGWMKPEGWTDRLTPTYAP